MKLSYQWLKEFIDFDESPEEVAKFLRQLGFDTIGITSCRGNIENVVTAKVETREKHPNADKLSLCKVFDGKNYFQVVCGAPNVAAGQTVPLARVGAKLPGDMEIKQAVLRGQESHGMLCSARELSLGDDHSGIFVLPEGTPLGKDIGETLLMDDFIIEIEVTPNRADALSHWGIARELAAVLNKKIHLPKFSIPKSKKISHLVEIKEPNLCARYVGRVVEGSQVKPSPLWMKLRLERCGIRSINNLVDVTNYVLLEFGHPLHVFDRDKLEGGRVIVRQSKKDEALLCLDGETRQVNGSLVIADEKKPVAIAGIMGGELSAVSDQSTHLLIESAHFHPPLVRKTRSNFNMSTESSYRFERGTDFEMVAMAAQRAASLILSLAGGKIIGEQDLQPKKPAKVKPIKVETSKMNAMLGMSMSSTEIKKSLQRFGFKVVSAKKAMMVTPPIHRHDIVELPDVAEEVVRLVGYDRIQLWRRASTQEPALATREQEMRRMAKDIFVSNGFFEVRNYGLVSKKLWDSLSGNNGSSAIELANPISQSGEILAPNLLVNLIANLQGNLRHGNKNVRLFEAAHVFSQKGSEILENDSLGWISTGGFHGDHWNHHPRPLDIWDVKSWIKMLLKDWRLIGMRLDSNNLPSFLHPGESQAIFVGERPMGYFGKIHPKKADLLEIPRETFLGELNLSYLSTERFIEIKYEKLPTQPALFRDFSMIFPETVSWSAIAMSLFRRSDWVENVDLFDVFKDDSLPKDHRSLAFQVSFRHSERTLTDTEVAEVQQKIIKGLEEDFKAQARTMNPI